MYNMIENDLISTGVHKLFLSLQKVMSFDLFPESVFDMEEKYYQTKMNAVCTSKPLRLLGI